MNTFVNLELKNNVNLRLQIQLDAEKSGLLSKLNKQNKLQKQNL